MKFSLILGLVLQFNCGGFVVCFGLVFFQTNVSQKLKDFWKAEISWMKSLGTDTWKGL